MIFAMFSCTEVSEDTGNNDNYNDNYSDNTTNDNTNTDNNTDNDNYDEYLETRRIEGIIKKYSDYVKYPIIMRVEENRLKDDAKDENDTEKVLEDKVLNSMIPIWKRNSDDCRDGLCNRRCSNFYRCGLTRSTRANNRIYKILGTRI